MDSPILADINWVRPWEPVDEGGSLEAELRRELIEGHPLFGIPATAVACRIDCDDVLFRTSDADCPFAVVHLTWSASKTKHKDWPWTQCFSSLQEWIEECMKVEHAEIGSE